MRQPLRSAEAGVHAQQVACEQRRFVATRAGADLEKDVASIVGILGQQCALELVCEARQVLFGAGELLGGHLRHVGVGEHFAGSVQVALALQEALVALDHRRHFRVLAREAPEPGQVGQHVRCGEHGVEIMKALDVAVELAAQGGFHRRDWLGGFV